MERPLRGSFIIFIENLTKHILYINLNGIILEIIGLLICNPFLLVTNQFTFQ